MHVNYNDDPRDNYKPAGNTDRASQSESQSRALHVKDACIEIL